MKTPPRSSSQSHSLFLLSLVLALAVLAASSGVAQEATAPATPAPEAEAQDHPDFVRYLKTDDSEELQTAAVRYVKDGRVVDLIAVVHLADGAYYDALNEHLKKYDAVLYELVGGKFEGRGEREVAPEMASIQVAQSVVQKMLGMEFQADGIAYESENFVHADVDWEQFDSLMASRNQSFGTILQRALMQAQKGAIPGLPADDQAAQNLMSSVVSSLTTGNTAGVKRILGPILGASEELITQMEGEDGTVLVTERNKVAMQILDREIKKGNRSLAIFYGAGHMTDLEERLLAKGFQKDGEAWLTAWDIVDTPSEERVNLIQQIFSDPEIIQTLMSAVQELMKQVESPAPDPAQ